MLWVAGVILRGREWYEVDAGSFIDRELCQVETGSYIQV